jgi:long-subunit acyl-CoA synthetase (AMP-forming)
MLSIKQSDDHRPEDEKKMFRLKNIIIMDEYDANKAQENYKIPAELNSKADSCGIKLYTFNEVLAKGKEKQADFVLKVPLPTDCMMFSYTSGTTGDPKGVKLTHQMICQTM